MTAAFSPCRCPVHAGCQHRPGWCLRLAVQTAWTSDHCRTCATRRERAIAAGLRAMRQRRPQDDLAVYERGGK